MLTLAAVMIIVEMCPLHLVAMKCDSVDYLIELMSVTVAAVKSSNESVVCASSWFSFEVRSKDAV